MHQFLYKLGHQPLVSVLELKQFIKLDGSLKAGDLGKFAQSNEEYSINSLGGSIARLRVIQRTKDLKCNYIDFLVESIQLYQDIAPVNKVGVFSNTRLNKPRVIKFCKDIGAKKINVIEADVFPSIGHIKSALTWFGIIKGNDELLCVVIEEYSDQEQWQVLDKQLPHKDMKRGIMNLKLSKILMNLTQDSVIWDPFCGHGRTLIGGIDSKVELIGSDRDDYILAQARDNINEAIRLIQNKKPELPRPKLQLFDHDVTEKLINARAILPESGFSIVTEGYLGPALSVSPEPELYHKLFDEITLMWTRFFGQLASTSVNDIVFCVPAYKTEQKFIINNRLLDSLETLIPTHHRYSHYQDIYARKDAIVGHQILILKRK